MTDVYVNGKRLRLDPAKAFGKGGEADVFDVGGMALKLYKGPDHPDLAIDPSGQQAARERIEVHQTKLRAFPTGLPSRVVSPVDLATDRAGRIVGYTMPMVSGAEVLLSYGQPDRNGLAANDMLAVLRDLHASVNALHGSGVVIGDFNDLNVLVRDTEAHLIDADSFQFGQFACRTFTSIFVDPLVCDQKETSPMLIGAHSPDTDWYAYTIMVMRSFLAVGPYGGVYIPPTPAQAMQQAIRPLRRVTVWHPRVRYPKPAVPCDRLPDEMLHHFHEVFEKDVRGQFPGALLERMRWTTCACGAEHARATCPACQKQAPAAVVTSTEIRGKVTATTMLRTTGAILRVAIRRGKLDVLLADGTRLRSAIISGGVASPSVDMGLLHPGIANPSMRYRIGGRGSVFIGKGSSVAELGPGGAVDQKLTADVAGSMPMFDTNSEHVFWVRGGVLQFDGDMGPERIGDVLEGQTVFWSGEQFGFGFYRAGSMARAFVFTARSSSLNDSVKMPQIIGKLIDAECVFSDDRAWLLTTTQEGASVVNRCCVMRADGAVEATAEAIDGDGSWLGRIRGGFAASNVLFVSTDDGLVQVRTSAGTVVVAKTFPDTEPFVNSSAQLFGMADGMYVVTSKSIARLVIAP